MNRRVCTLLLALALAAAPAAARADELPPPPDEEKPTPAPGDSTPEPPPPPPAPKEKADEPHLSPVDLQLGSPKSSTSISPEKLAKIRSASAWQTGGRVIGGILAVSGVITMYTVLYAGLLSLAVLQEATWVGPGLLIGMGISLGGLGVWAPLEYYGSSQLYQIRMSEMPPARRPPFEMYASASNIKTAGRIIAVSGSFIGLNMALIGGLVDKKSSEYRWGKPVMIGGFITAIGSVGAWIAMEIVGARRVREARDMLRRTRVSLVPRVGVAPGFFSASWTF